MALQQKADQELSLAPKMKFRLREMQPSDSIGVRDLITEEGGAMTTYFVIDAYSAMITYAEFPTVGVVAEADGHDGVAGVATVRFGSCQFNGELLPFAFLDSLKVSEQFRGQGLGAKLAEWWAKRARSEYGERVVLLSGTTTDNVASQKTMARWCREFTQSIDFRILRTTDRPPKALQRIKVRTAQLGDYEELALKQNRFHKEYNLYVPVSAESLAAENTNTPTEEPLSQHFVALSDSHAIVGGVSARYKGDLMYDKLNLPFPLRAATAIFRLLPPDNILRDVQMKGLWYEGGHEEAVGQLLDTVRYHYHEKSSIIGYPLDPRSPFAKMIRRNRLLPAPRLILGLWGPTLLDRDRLLTINGRA